MTFSQIRLAQRVLLILFVVSAAYVGHLVWEGVRSREAPRTGEVAEPQAAVSREVEIEQLDSEGRRAWTLKAAESSGRTESSQQFRDVEIRFEASGASEESVPVVVTADECEIYKDSSVFLQGNVVVRDDTSLRLEARSLHFQRHPDRIWSTEPVRYYRDDLEGDAGDMRYRMEAGVLDLGGGVAMTLQRSGEAPVRIASEGATMRRRAHLVRFVDGVRVLQGDRSLVCNDLQLYLTENNETIERMEAFEAVELSLQVRGEESASSDVGLASEPGSKRLFTDRLEVLLRPGGEHLERARAIEGGRLEITLPEDAREGYHKQLEGYTLAFDFDEQGRLEVLRGRGGVTLTLTPVDGSGEEKIVTARQLEADFDPETGDLNEARCERAVTFEQGSVRASSELGTFRSDSSLLVLRESPRLWDDKARLEAREIRIDVESGDVEGEGDVRSTSDRLGGEGKSLPGGSEEPIYFVSEHLRFDRARDLALYTGAARGIQGENRIEADRIEILQGKGDLSAAGNVRTIFLQRVGTEDKPPEPTVTDSERLVYASEMERMQYRGGVEMRSREMTLKGKAVDVSLAPGGAEVQEIFAEGDVSIETPDGKASGDDAKYLPKEEKMTVTGDQARLENDGKLTEGKQLTFFLSDDRIFVDGREQSRTKTTYSSKPRL